MKITLLSNAGLAVEAKGQMLLIDVPNNGYGPYYGLPAEEWERILEGKPPYDQLIGLYFTHDHPDHCDHNRLEAIRSQRPELPVFFPKDTVENGILQWGVFRLEYTLFPHVPMLKTTPHHVVTWIEADGYRIYLSADAMLDTERHRAVLNGRKADLAIWNAMYLSRPETRQLLNDAAKENRIYHMPANHEDWAGIWKKCRLNYQRHGEELKAVQVWGSYPSAMTLP